MAVLIGLAVLLFGATAIPKLARAFGTARGEFKRAQDAFEGEVKLGEQQAATKTDAKK